MYLKQIITQGFKSFADRINIDFDKGITCIVGPNGSGKSNIVDAVKWVLGEQSIKQLRGGDSMTDVIFSGSKSRNPSNYASVTLVFDNYDRHLNVDYTEVSIKRVLYRNKDTEYYINNEKCRLKDVLNLLVDSGACRDSFNIISQGDVASIFSSKPEDRRVIFESAAGVLKYKKRKEEAQRKLEHTRDNIERVSDIINELETRIEPLREQQESATKYVNAKKELEDIETSLIVSDIDKINNDTVSLKSRLEKLNNDVLEIDNNLMIDYSKLEKEKLNYSKLTSDLNKYQQQLLEQTSVVEKLNSEKSIISERKKYDSNDVKIHSNVINLKEQEMNMSNKLDLLNKDIKDLYKNISSCEVNKSEIDLILKNYQTEYEILANKINDSIKERISLEYKISTLEHNIDSNNDLSYSVRSVLNNSRLKGIHNALGKIIDFDEKYSTAINVALGASSQFVICDDDKSAKDAISYLKQNNFGRVTFFPLNVIEKRSIDETTYNYIKEDVDFIDVLSNLVKYDDLYKNIVLNQMGNIIVTSNLDSANRISKRINHQYRIVTLDGELLHVGGSITGGNINKNTLSDKVELVNSKELLLNINHNTSDLETKKATLENNIATNKKKYEEYCSELISLKQTVSAKEETKEEYEINLDKVSNEVNSIESTHEFDEEQIVLEKYFNELKNKEGITRNISELNKNIDICNSTICELEHNIKELNSNLSNSQCELKDIEVNITRKDMKIESLLQILNEDYNMTFERAKKEYILVLDEQIARKKVNELRRIIKELGMVNIAAIEEYKTVSTRYEFLSNQKTDLYKAENTLSDIIKEMDIIMRDNFLETFKMIQSEFKNVFKELFKGGTAELKLTDPNNVLETGVDISALPPGKKLQHISLLSGGEKALTSIALLFSILRTKPIPFCLLDEVEAPLDEVNIDVFGKFLSGLKTKTQFIIVTHQKKTMEYADTLYGITMQESGVSKLVSVKLNELK